MSGGPESGASFIGMTPSTTKSEAYQGPVAESGYPLLYALCLDLRRYDPGISRDFTGSPRVRVIQDEAIKATTDIIPTARPSIIQAMGERGIPFRETTNIKNNCSDYPLSEGIMRTGNLDLSLSAATPEDLEIFQRGLLALAEPLGYIPEVSSRTSEVEKLLRDIDPIVELGYNGRSAVKAVLDGFFSIYIDAVSHSQRPIIGNEGLSAKDRLLRVLRSDVITQSTRKTRLSTRARLGSVGIIPDNQLVEGDAGLTLHPDEEAFLDIANKFLSVRTPPPSVCPFAFPLDKMHAEGAVSHQYRGRLPDDVSNSVANNRMNTAGIRTAGQAIASYLEKAI